jgi:hypothetical protein
VIGSARTSESASKSRFIPNLIRSDKDKSDATGGKVTPALSLRLCDGVIFGYSR